MRVVGIHTRNNHSAIDDRHRGELHASGVTEEMISAAGIYSAEGGEIHQVLRWQPKNAVWGRGWVIPFRFEGEPGVTFYRVKLDHPRRDKDGDIIKYESPIKVANRAYVPPGFCKAIEDERAPILITEGEKKALSAMCRGFACIGLVGVWGFSVKRPRRKTGRATGPRQLIEDLNGIRWGNRRVCIVFDSDAAENPEVQRAERALASVLSGRGVAVRVVRLPQLGDRKTGLDDFLVHHGDEGAEELRELLASADSEAGANANERQDAKAVPPMELADAYIETHFMHADGPRARHWRDELHVWTGTRYRPIPDGDFAKTVLQWLDSQVDKAKPRLARDVVECVGARLLVPAYIEQPVFLGAEGAPTDSPDWIAMSNGILDLPAALSGKDDPLRLHTPLWFSTNALPYAYDPTAECPRWFTFLDSVFDGDEERVNLLAEWFGYCLTSETRYQAVMLLEGPRRSGKGTTLRTLRRVVGQHNCAEPRLSTLAELFGLSGLVGKTVAMCPDAHLGHGDRALSTLEILKSVSGEDAIEVHRKHRPSIHVRLRTRFILSVNELPRFGDSANALLSRLVVLPYRNCYQGREDRELEDKVSEEVPGIFNWALWGLQRLWKNGRFTVPEVSWEVLADFGRLTSPLSAFLEDCCTILPTEQVDRRELFEAWKAWCEANGHRAGSREVFGARLRTLVPRLDTVQFRDATPGKRRRVYLGIGLAQSVPDENPEQEGTLAE